MTGESFKSISDFEIRKSRLKNGEEFVNLNDRIAIFQNGTEIFYKKAYDELKNVIFGQWK